MKRNTVHSKAEAVVEQLSTYDVIVGTLLAFGPERWFSRQCLAAALAKAGATHFPLKRLADEARLSRDLVRSLGIMTMYYIVESSSGLTLDWYRFRSAMREPAEQSLVSRGMLTLHQPLFDEIAKDLSLRPT